MIFSATEAKQAIIFDLGGVLLREAEHNLQHLVSADTGYQPVAINWQAL